MQFVVTSARMETTSRPQPKTTMASDLLSNIHGSSSLSDTEQNSKEQKAFSSPVYLKYLTRKEQAC